MTIGRCIVIAVLLVVGFVAIAQAPRMSAMVSDAFVYTDAAKASEQATIIWSAANLKAQQDIQTAGDEQIRISRETALIGKTFPEALQMRAEWAKEARQLADERIAACWTAAAQKPPLEASQMRSDCSKVALEKMQEQIDALPEPQ